jgi:GT2 family glycosyltransferase
MFSNSLMSMVFLGNVCTVRKRGQHYSHQLIQEQAKGDFIFRIDDDEIAEPQCLEILSNIIQEDETIGAVAPLVLMPDANYLPDKLFNSITDLTKPNVQWFKQKENSIREAEHLYSCFLYRKGIARYPLSLSRKAFREETLLTHSIIRAGYTLLIASEARVFHWRANSGGIRSDNNIQDYENDEKIFQSYLNLWNIKSDDKKIAIFNNGLAIMRHFINVLPELKKKHKKVSVACCYPDIFFEHEDVELISIAEAKMLYGDIEAFNVYKYCAENNHKENLVKAFEKMYL